MRGCKSTRFSRDNDAQLLRGTPPADTVASGVDEVVGSETNGKENNSVPFSRVVPDDHDFQELPKDVEDCDENAAEPSEKTSVSGIDDLGEDDDGDDHNA